MKWLVAAYYTPCALGEFLELLKLCYYENLAYYSIVRTPSGLVEAVLGFRIYSGTDVPVLSPHSICHSWRLYTDDRAVLKYLRSHNSPLTNIEEEDLEIYVLHLNKPNAYRADRFMLRENKEEASLEIKKISSGLEINPALYKDWYYYSYHGAKPDPEIPTYEEYLKMLSTASSVNLRYNPHNCKFEDGSTLICACIKHSCESDIIYTDHGKVGEEAKTSKNPAAEKIKKEAYAEASTDKLTRAIVEDLLTDETYEEPPEEPPRPSETKAEPREEKPPEQQPAKKIEPKKWIPPHLRNSTPDSGLRTNSPPRATEPAKPSHGPSAVSTQMSVGSKQPAPPALEPGQVRKPEAPNATVSTQLRPTAAPYAGGTTQLRPTAAPYAGGTTQLRPTAAPYSGGATQLRPTAVPYAGGTAQLRPAPQGTAQLMPGVAVQVGGPRAGPVSNEANNRRIGPKAI